MRTKKEKHFLQTAPIVTWNELMHAVNLGNTEKSVLFIADRPELVAFANKYSDQIFELYGKRQLLARVNAEVARREIEAVLQGRTC